MSFQSTLLRIITKLEKIKTEAMFLRETNVSWLYKQHTSFTMVLKYGEAANTNFIVSGLTGPGIESTLPHSRRTR